MHGVDIKVRRQYVSALPLPKHSRQCRPSGVWGKQVVGQCQGCWPSGSWVVSFEPVKICILPLARCDGPDWSALYRHPSERLPVVEWSIAWFSSDLPTNCRDSSHNKPRPFALKVVSQQTIDITCSQSATVTGVCWSSESYRAIASCDVLLFGARCYFVHTMMLPHW